MISAGAGSRARTPWQCSGRHRLPTLYHRSITAGQRTYTAMRFFRWNGTCSKPLRMAPGESEEIHSHSLRLYGENPGHVAPAGAPKRRAFFRRWHTELGVKLADVLFPQKGIGARRAGNSRVGVPAASALARFQNCAPTGPAPVVNRPQSSVVSQICGAAASLGGA